MTCLSSDELVCANWKSAQFVSCGTIYNGILNCCHLDLYQSDIVYKTKTLVFIFGNVCYQDRTYIIQRPVQSFDIRLIESKWDYVIHWWMTALKTETSSLVMSSLTVDSSSIITVTARWTMVNQYYKYH
jgi:hypothetical protein